MKIIPNARRVAVRAYSQIAQATALAILGAYSAMPDKLQDALPGGLVIGLACAALVLGFVGRLIEQPELQQPDPQPPGGEP